jgi:hypothetical protein
MDDIPFVPELLLKDRYGNCAVRPNVVRSRYEIGSAGLNRVPNGRGSAGHQSKLHREHSMAKIPTFEPPSRDRQEHMPPLAPETMTEAQKQAAAELATGPRGGLCGPFIASCEARS